MGKPWQNRNIDMFFVLLIFCVFSICSLVVLMLGGSLYQHTVAQGQDGYNERTALSYIWTRVKNGDGAGMVKVGEFNGLSVLCLEEQYDQVIYQTRIYVYEGWVRELFSEEGLDFQPQDGQPVIQADSLSFEELAEGIIEAKVNQRSLLLYPRGQGYNIRD